MTQPKAFPPNHDDESPQGEALGSLSDYIAKRLQKRLAMQHDPDATQQGTNTFQSKQPPTPNRISGPAKDAGMILHHLDNELASGHLERYLPTAVTRYHMTRERVNEELNHIYEALRHYRQFQGTEYQIKIQALEHRSAFLQRKLFELDHPQDHQNPLQGMLGFFEKLSKTTESLSKAGDSAWTFIPNHKQQLQQEFSSVSNELQSLQSILEEQLHDACFTADQFSRLVSQYDQELARAEKLMAELKSQKNLTTQVKEALKNWIGFPQQPT